MKAILFRSNNIFASRCAKYVNYFQKINIDFVAVGWDRNSSLISRKNYDFYRYKAGVAVGGMRAVLNHLHWMIFVYRYMKQHSNVNFVHACDLNSAFPVALFRYFHNRKDVILIFDVCDWFSANFCKYKFLRFFFHLMERFTVNHASCVIVCESERVEQIQFKFKTPLLVLPNIPEIDESLLFHDDEKFKFDNGWPVFAYFGGFSEDRFLLELIRLAKTERVNILIGGFGSKIIEDACSRLNDLPNFRYFGKLSLVEGLSMSSYADVIYAMYCKSNPNHIYAAPNKYYEAMFLGKPILSTKGIILEKKILENNIGYVIEEDIDCLRNFIREFNLKDSQIKGRRSRLLWDKEYSSYVKRFFENEYTDVINN